jgi:hypothetical protein
MEVVTAVAENELSAFSSSQSLSKSPLNEIALKKPPNGSVASNGCGFQQVYKDSPTLACSNETSFTPVPGANGTAGSDVTSTTPTPTNCSTFDIMPYSRTLAYRTTGRQRKPGSFNFKEENIKAYTDANGIVYKVSG